MYLRLGLLHDEDGGALRASANSDKFIHIQFLYNGSHCARPCLLCLVMIVNYQNELSYLWNTVRYVYYTFTMLTLSHAIIYISARSWPCFLLVVVNDKTWFEDAPRSFVLQGTDFRRVET